MFSEVYIMCTEELLGLATLVASCQQSFLIHVEEARICFHHIGTPKKINKILLKSRQIAFLFGALAQSLADTKDYRHGGHDGLHHYVYHHDVHPGSN